MDEKLVSEIAGELEKRRREWEITKLKEELDVLRWWRSEEAKYRILTIARLLCLLGERKLDLSFCYLKGARFDRIELKGANLSGANCEGAFLNTMDLRKTDFIMARLRKAKLWGSDLSGAELFKADLREADLTRTILDGANLSEADLRWAKSLTIEQLSKAEALFRAKLDPELMETIKKDYPVLLRDPDLV